jgi:hypothetical protein
LHLGKLLRAASRQKEAGPHLADASTMYREMGMRVLDQVGELPASD